MSRGIHDGYDNIDGIMLMDRGMMGWLQPGVGTQRMALTVKVHNLKLGPHERAWANALTEQITKQHVCYGCSEQPKVNNKNARLIFKCETAADWACNCEQGWHA
jgi:hypothetical protein